MSRTIAVLLLTLVCAFDLSAQRRRAVSPAGECNDPLLPESERVKICPGTQPGRPVCDSSAEGWRAFDVYLPPEGGVFPMKIWQQTRCPEAERIALDLLEAVEGDHIRERVVEYMGRAPLSDGAVACENGEGNGGDDAFDVYVVHDQSMLSSGAKALAFHTDLVCQRTAAYVYMNVTRPGALAHELCHAAQAAYTWSIPGCINQLPSEPGMGSETVLWWAEATATAGESLMYPKRRQRDDYVQTYMDSTEQPLDARRTHYGYSVYPFALFLELGFKPGTVAQTWAQLEQTSSVAEAIARATGDGGNDTLVVWPLFTRQLVNRAPWNEFCEWDALPYRAKMAEEKELALDGKPDAEVTFESKELQRLSATFYHLEIASDVRSLTFENPFAGQKNISVQAHLTFAGGRTDGQDWTKDERKFFCLDRKEERISEITLVVSNGAWKPGAAPVKPDKPIRFIATNVGCWRWEGTSTVGGEVTVGPNSSWRLANARFTFERSGSTEDETGRFDIYRIVDVHVDWKAGARPCGDQKSGTIGSAPDAFLRIANWLPDSTAYRRYMAWGTTHTEGVTCDDGSILKGQSGIDWLSSQHLGEADLAMWRKVPARGTIDDSRTIEAEPIAGGAGTANTRRTWKLIPLREE